MANQLSATVYQIDGNPQKQPITVSFLTNNIFIKEASISTIPDVQSAIVYYPNTSNQLETQTFYVGEYIDSLYALANLNNASMVKATVLDINGDPQVTGGVQYCFPVLGISIWETVDGLMQVNSTIQFKNKKYGVSETESELNSTANSTTYKVYTALLSQTGDSSPDTIDAAPLTVGVTYTIESYYGDDDFTNVGAPSNTSGVIFVATGTTPANWSSNSTLSLNLATPVVKVLENTIGNVWFSYDDTGSYYINSDALFTANKTYVVTQFWGDDSSTVRTSITNWESTSVLHLYNRDTGGNAENTIGSNTNPVTWLTSIEIRIYS